MGLSTKPHLLIDLQLLPWSRAPLAIRDRQETRLFDLVLQCEWDGDTQPPGADFFFPLPILPSSSSFDSKDPL